jgi:flagellar basal-body rod modification protein FlgD
MSTSPILPAPHAAGSPTPPTTTALPTGQSLNNMFLQLLVAQLQHQDPTSPVDPSQFIGQLAQFSQLSETTSIYQLLQQMAQKTASSGSGAGASGGAVPTTGTASPPAASSVPSASISMPSSVTPALSALANSIQGAY